MIRKVPLVWKCVSPAVFSEIGFHSTNGCKYLWNSLQVPIRWCSNETIFKVPKKILWDESFEKQTRSEPETSSSFQAVEEDEAEDLVDLNNAEPKTLAEATILNQLRIKKLHEMLQYFDEQTKHEKFLKKFSKKWNLKLELRKARSVRPQDQIAYTKEMLAVIFFIHFLYLDFYLHETKNFLYFKINKYD
ncbi:unnamed protein product [Onchocerca flexuosa]|uniref:28S ribosomal protein S15, mitochondrial n=1 Tax=Onchocerca flexuosa TaxID=387005 RepID=A0A183H764_9BILA|nr:unnamed protein product [Onchocerca flexuosa]